MTHLADDQFEDIVQGRAPEPAHLAECPACRARLAEQRAIRARLHASFASVHADAALAERLRGAGDLLPAAERHARPSKVHHLSRFAWATLAAAAAVIIIAVPAVIYLTTANPASAAQAELVRIHTGNLAAHHPFYTEADPTKLADYLKTQLGFEPAAPRVGQGMAIRGCCLAHFKGEHVGSYVVDTPRGPISIIVMPQAPEALGMHEKLQAGGKTFWADSFARNSMVAVRIGAYTYCAVGEVPPDLLTQVLLNLGLSGQP
jgi:hypothetical protein